MFTARANREKKQCTEVRNIEFNYKHMINNGVNSFLLVSCQSNTNSLSIPVY